MDVIKKGVVALLKSAVTGQPQPLPEGFKLPSAEEIIRCHHIITLIYEGAIRCGVSTQESIMQTFFFDYCKALYKSERQMKELQRLFSAFDENGVEYMPLKGCNLKKMYPKPELRVMGDADVLIRIKQYEKISCIMRELGFEEKGETDHELPWQSAGLYLELHKRLVPSYNKDFHAYFGDGWSLAKQMNGTRYAMSVENAFIYLFAHFAKHYRDGGIGCRHVVDLWVYRRANPNMDLSYVEKELSKMNLLTFYYNVSRLIKNWFEDGIADDITEFMTEVIFANGNWGEKEAQVVSAALRQAETFTSGHKTKIAYLRSMAFPSLEVLRGKYRILKKAPFLLPVVWLVRPFYKVLFERKTLKDRKSDIELINDENIKRKKLLLDYVGLGYWF